VTCGRPGRADLTDDLLSNHSYLGHHRTWPPCHTAALGCCSMLTSTVTVAVISAAASSAATALLSNCHGIWRSLRKARRHLAGRIGRWWTRHEGYIPRFSRSRDFRHVAWWNTGPYWLNSPPAGYPAPGVDREICSDGPCGQIELASFHTEIRSIQLDPAVPSASAGPHLPDAGHFDVAESRSQVILEQPAVQLFGARLPGRSACIVQLAGATSRPSVVVRRGRKRRRGR